MVCFFPSGTYKISDTLVCRAGIHVRSHLKRINYFGNMPCVLMGSTKGKTRPKILLAANSLGFNNPEKLKYLIQHILYNIDNKGNVNTDFEQSKQQFNVIFNAMIVNLDVVIGEGNSGAIGIRMNSAEGSGIQDVTIDATNGYAGLDGAAGNGGSWENITIIGGQIGIMNIDGFSVPTPTMAGITLINQTKAAIISKYRGSFTAVGLKIISKISGPLIILKKGSSPFDNTMNLVDSEIIFETSANENKTVFAFP